MTTRVLPYEDWSRLDETDLASHWRTLPSGSVIIVAEDGGRIVGTWALLQAFHVEGLWVDPGYRRTGVAARRLIAAMRQIVKSYGVEMVFTMAQTDEIRSAIDAFGGSQLNVTTHVLPVTPQKKRGATWL